MVSVGGINLCAERHHLHLLLVTILVMRELLLSFPVISHGSYIPSLQRQKYPRKLWKKSITGMALQY